jgi:DNA-binding transcriptional regulator GbsR (MarR family)
MSNRLLLIFSGVLFLFNLILTFIVSKLKKECDLNVEYSKNVLTHCSQENFDMQSNILKANTHFRNMRKSYLTALDLAVKHYKQSAKEKVRKLTYITKR